MIMKITTMRNLCSAVFAGSLLAFSGTASAVTTITDFDSITLGGTYVSWSSGTITSGATSLNVQASNGFGGGFYDIDPNADATDETDIALEVTINTANEEAGLGVVLALFDEDGTLWNYSWFGLLPGQTYTLGAHIIDDLGWESEAGTVGGLDVSDISFIHIQVDTGGDPAPYDLSFNDLSLIGAPVTAIPGDLDGDGFVGISDLNLVLSDWNKTVPPANPAADPSGDSFVGIADLNVVLGNWNAGTPPAAGAAVPEPATLGLLGLGGIAMLKRRH
jgi:hypothetical protein